MVHEFDGKKYEKTSTHQKEWGAKLISELALKGNERVLDLGCGDGTNTAMIADLLPGGNVVGIDASRGMIAAARPKVKDNLKFELMDINEISLVEEFDIIYSNATLHWIKDHVRLLKKVHTALRIGGLVRFNFAGDGNCSHFFKVVREAMKNGKYSRYFSDFSWPWYMPKIAEYTKLVHNSELKAAKVWDENADRYFPDTETMIGWIDQPSLVPFMAYIPDTHKADFREYVIDEMIQATRQSDGRCFETFRRINLIARK